MIPKIVLLTIGDEIVSGTTVDTNSNFIAGKLKENGYSVSQIITIADNPEEIKKALHQIFEKADLVIATGGLGPTKDDKTKTALAEFFGVELEHNEVAYDHLKNILTQRNRAHLLEINRPQAALPKNSMVFLNDNGTAPAFSLAKNDKLIFSLPGVPYEVKPLINDKILPFIKQNFEAEFIITKFLSVIDFPESLLSETIEDWELSLPKNISLSYLPIANRVKLKFTAQGSCKDVILQELEEQIELLKPLLGQKLIATDEEKIENILIEKLKEKCFTISCAESCTGGAVANLLASVSGISSFFPGGLITYQVEQKVRHLAVSERTIEKYTVVSSEVALEMSRGCQKYFDSDIAVATTGVAGPASDEFGNPVGLVHYAIRIKKFEKSFKLFLPHLDREDFMKYVAMKVLQDLVILLENNRDLS